MNSNIKNQFLLKKSVLLFLVLSSFESNAQFKSNEPLAHTFSIVARDPKTGEMAVAVQSHWFSVGSVVSWGEAGVGVVATQSFINKSFGIRGLELLKHGKSSQEALDFLLKDDNGRDYRQVAILDEQGRVAAYTGKSCIAEASHYAGDGFSVQANMMLNNKVVPAMEKAWKENSNFPLAERIISVIKSAQQAGGDIRGKQSAALLVVAAKASNEPWNDRKVDLRVDDSSDPVAELERLLKVFRAYEHMNLGDLHVEKNEMDLAMSEYHAAMKMFPENLEMQYWTAITLANNKNVKEAATMLQKIYLIDSNWRQLTLRLRPVGLLNVSDQDLKELCK